MQLTADLRSSCYKRRIIRDYRYKIWQESGSMLPRYRELLWYVQCFQLLREAYDNSQVNFGRGESDMICCATRSGFLMNSSVGVRHPRHCARHIPQGPLTSFRIDEP